MISRLYFSSDQKKRKSTGGFVMPMVLIMMTTIMIISLLVNQSIVINQRQITRYGYVLIARAAAKAAVDYAKEELDSNLAYCGTDENRNDPGDDENSTVLYTDGDYQVTYEVDIYDDDCSGSARNIRAVGRVYIPDISLNVAFVEDIRVRLVRSGLYNESPDDFSPVAWYRADDSASVLQTVAGTDSDSFRFEDAHEEETDGSASFWSCFSWNNDLEFHVGNENSGQQNIGVHFDDVDIPDGATITNAYIQFRSRGINGTGGTNAQLSQPLVSNIRGFDEDNKSEFSCPGSNQLNNVGILTSSQVNWNIPAWSTQNQQGAAQQTPNISSIVQEVIDRPGWSSGNNMAFRLSRVSGSGLRNASKTSSNHIRLYVEWEEGAGSGEPATNGSTVTQWLDQTANGNHLSLANGTPTLNTNELNGKQIVEFQAAGDSPDVLANTAFSPGIDDSDGLTAIAVMRPANTGSSTGNDRFITMINSAQTNDTVPPATNGNVRAFTRNALTNNMIASANGYTTQALSNVLGNSFAGSSWGVFAFTIGNDSNERFSRNGEPSDLFASGNNTSFDVDRLLLGGTSNGSGGYTFAGDMQLAELVIYDKVLSCSQIRLIENYYEQNSTWDISSTDYNCPLQ